ncbi:hypothetical protein [Candidatus Lokiarchaeum ossiferum]|uniref:hypothetical protein n=1 Tax=Candidatus Lokiarchaeum ossiferum TaxID=2951803 RepID=UPI00352EA521
MDRERFAKYIQENLGEKYIEIATARIDHFENYLKSIGKSLPTLDNKDILKYTRQLGMSNDQLFGVYNILYNFGLFAKNGEILVGCMLVYDGSEILQNLYERLEKEFGCELRDTIFDGIELPPIDLDQKLKPQYMKKIVPRLLDQLGQKKTEDFLAIGLHDRYEQLRQPDRTLFLDCTTLEEFLERRYENLINDMKKHRDEGTPWFVSYIDDEILDFYAQNPDLYRGHIENNTIVIKKGPYDTKGFINATTREEKRRSICHCPFVRESLIEAAQPIDPVFCNCSAGFEKAYWEIIFATSPIQVEVKASILRGDDFCEFAVHIPEAIMHSHYI